VQHEIGNSTVWDILLNLGQNAFMDGNPVFLDYIDEVPYPEKHNRSRHGPKEQNQSDSYRPEDRGHLLSRYALL